jgi:hypothetical protein
MYFEGVGSLENMYTFWDQDRKPGYDAITGYNGFGYKYFTIKKDSVNGEFNENGIVVGDSAKKYMTRLQEDLQKIEDFTNKDYDAAMKNK